MVRIINAGNKRGQPALAEGLFDVRMMKNWYFVFVFLYAVSAWGQDVGVSPLSGNPEKWYRTEGQKPWNPSKIAYPAGGNEFFLFDTLSLPFVDDFSRDRFKKYYDWALPDPVDSVRLRYVITPTPVYPLVYVEEPSFTYSITGPTTVDSVANPSYQVVLYNNPLFPFTPSDTVTVWLYSSRRYFYNADNNTVDSSFIPFEGTYTADTTDTIKVYFPTNDQARWIDNYGYRNNTMAKSPPTLGVVTLDGTNEKGVPYRPGVVSSYGVADYVTSKPLHLNGTPADSVYLSFFYQPQGIGYAPGPVDSLVVEFKNPQTEQWHWIWSVPGRNVDTFKQVMIPITDTIFLKSGFQFRFKNYANLSGNHDHWNIDYVRLARNRSWDDTLLQDVAFVEIQQTLLRRYRSMPYHQFTQLDVENKWANKITNLDVVPKQICYQYIMRDSAGNQLNHYTQDYTPLPSDTNTILPVSTSGYATYFRFAEPDFNFNFQNAGLLPFTERKDYFFTHYITNLDTDVNTENDTNVVRQIFHNYYAYDDGTAEEAIWLGTPGRMAVKFTANFADSLRAIQVYFSPIREDVTSRYIDLKVWSSLEPENTLYTEKRQIRVNLNDPTAYIDTVNNGFTTYILEEAVPLPAGDFYIGWYQNQTFKANVGFDKNTNTRINSYYRTGQVWDTIGFDGTIMIRPMVGAKITKDLIGVENPEVQPFTLVYPNPATDYVQLHYVNGVAPEQLRVFDLTGKMLFSTATPTTKLDVSGWPPGMYIVQCSWPGQFVPEVKKLIISR